MLIMYKMSILDDNFSNRCYRIYRGKFHSERMYLLIPVNLCKTVLLKALMGNTGMSVIALTDQHGFLFSTFTVQLHLTMHHFRLINGIDCISEF